MGEGVPADDAEAAKWLRLAAKQGHANAQEMLGHLYSTSRRMRNLPLAHMWLNLAGANGVEEARETRLSLELEMSGNDIGRAQQLARTCHESSYSDCGE